MIHKATSSSATTPGVYIVCDHTGGEGVPPRSITFHGAEWKNEARAILAASREIDRADVPGIRAIRTEAEVGRSYMRTSGPRSATRVNRLIIRADEASATQAARAASPCALEAPGDTALGTVNRLGPAPIGRNPGNYSPHVFWWRFRQRKTDPRLHAPPQSRPTARRGRSSARNRFRGLFTRAQRVTARTRRFQPQQERNRRS